MAPLQKTVVIIPLLYSLTLLPQLVTSRLSASMLLMTTTRPFLTPFATWQPSLRTWPLLFPVLRKSLCDLNILILHKFESRLGWRAATH